MFSVTFLICAGIITMFSTLFYLEDREGGGLYDPSSVHPPDKKK